MTNFPTGISDAQLELFASTAVSTATTTVGTNVLDLSLRSVPTTPAPSIPFLRGDVIIHVTALADMTTGDEDYDFIVYGSTDAAFTTPVNLGSLFLDGSNAAATGVISSRYMFPVTNQVGGTPYRYLRMSLVTVGTSPSITFSSYLTIRTW